jgi:hypothetical protein
MTLHLDRYPISNAVSGINRGALGITVHAHADDSPLLGNTFTAPGVDNTDYALALIIRFRAAPVCLPVADPNFLGYGPQPPNSAPILLSS